MTAEELLRAQYQLLGHAGLGYTEFRLIKYPKGQVTVGFAIDEQSFVVKGLKFVEQKDQMVFVGLNPREEAEHGNLENIQSLNVIMIDIDPIRPSGEASTDEQHEKALSRGRYISADIPGSVLVDSGSGAHVYIPVQPILIDNPDMLTQKLKIYHESLRKKYETDGLKIDATFDLPRVTRLWGSFNPKSKRVCKPTQEFDTWLFPRTKLELPNIEEVKISEIREPYLVRFGQVVNNSAALKNIMAGIGLYTSPSEANMAFVSLLTKAQFDTESIKKLARLNPFMKKSQKTEEQIDQDVERIVEKVKNENTSISMSHGSAKYLKGLNARKPGYLTGFNQLDNKLAGIQNARLYVLAARTNEGKTSFAVNLAYNLVKSGTSVLYFPTEIGYEPLFDKIVSQATEVSLRKFQFGNFTPEETKKIETEVKTLQNYPFIVHEDFALTLRAINSKARAICPQVIIVDYIQALQYEKGGEPHEIADVVRGLKELNEKLNVPIILCSQFSRAAIGAELSLAHLKGSGAIEEFADVVMALSTISKLDYPRIVDLHILKSRYSEIGKVRFNFWSAIGKFEEKQDD